MKSVAYEEDFKNEKKFSHFLMSQCLHVRRWSLTVALLLYIVFAVMDVLKFPSEIYTITLSTRTILVILPLLYLNIIYWLKPPISIRANAITLLMIYLGAGLNHTLIFYVSQLYGFPFSQLGLVLIIMFGCLLLVLPIKPAAIMTFIMLCAHTAAHLYTTQQLADLLFVLIILSFVAGICLTINKLGQKTLYKNYLLINRLYNESITDGLTKLNNKRAFQEQIERLNAIASRDEVSLGLVFVDADYFKAVNDTFGHRAGDDVLKKIAQVVDAKCRRSTDMGFRIGGDEFALILYGVNQAVLENTCREIVKDVADFHLKVNRENIKTSVSVGAILKSNSAKITSTKLIELADEYLYQAKKNGRNQFDLSVFQPA
jgi:diguanylate cyclase (GGDEF)-like protein